MSEKARVMMEKLKQNSMEGNKDEDYVSDKLVCIEMVLKWIYSPFTERTPAETA